LLQLITNAARPSMIQLHMPQLVLQHAPLDAQLQT